MSHPPGRYDGPPDGSWRDRMPDDRSTDRPGRGATEVVGSRIVAQIVDLIVLFVQLLVVAYLLALVLQPSTRSAVGGITALATLTLPLYGGILESHWRGQTVGKRFAGIAVVNGRGNPPSFRKALTRNLPAVVVFSWATTAVALASIAVTDRNQRLFDQVAGTYVVRR